MPTFVYEAMSSVGQPIKGEVDAGSSEEAIAKVRAMGNFPTKIKEKPVKRGSKTAAGAGVPGLQRAGRARRSAGRVSKKLLCQFTRQLSTLHDAGLPILRSLRILEQQQKPGMMRVAIRLVAEDVEGGASLSEAMGRHPRTFDRLFVNMVRAGELGGVLDVVLQGLANFMEKAQALKRKVIGAMIYPAAVISFALIIVTLLLISIVPQFKMVFDEMRAELPYITRLLMGMSEWVKAGGWIAILGTPILVFVIFKVLKQSKGGRMFVDQLKLHIPVLGGIVSKSAVARFTRTLGVLISAGVPILEAVHITRETAGNEVFARALDRVRDGIREGESVAEPLRQTRVVEPMVVNMIDVGEETGELDKMLGKVADTYDEEVETMVSSMVSLLEPLMVVTLGVIVGFIVVALFMPMVSMIDNLSQGR